MTTPPRSILHEDFVYVPSKQQQDVTRHWRRAGWLPKDEQPQPKVTPIAIKKVGSK